MIVHTVGHSNHPIDRFMSLLDRHGVTALADVRSTPHSRFNPQFNREALKASLAGAGIAYLWLGDALGGRAEDPALLEDGRVRYDRVARTARFRDGLTRLALGAQSGRLALMCAERDPLHCHRMILVSRHLAEAGGDIRHILADGALETQAEAEDRLLARHGLAHDDLLRTRADRLDEAYARQAGQIAWRRPIERQSSGGAG
jgi:uncharacterized protein (DUF488 family)